MLKMELLLCRAHFLVPLHFKANKFNLAEKYER